MNTTSESVRSGTLIERFAPVARFDSRETGFPVSAGAWTDAPGQVLRRADGPIVAGGPGGPPLTLGFLGPERYADGTAVQPGDVITGAGPESPSSAGRALAATPPYADRFYGRATVGSDGRLWLQYRWFYIYNEYRVLGHIGVGEHEGDWEMIQLRLDGERPDLVLTLHHRRVVTAPLAAVHRDGDHVIVYVARGSHGLHFEPGRHRVGAALDRADGRGTERPLALSVVDDTSPEWAWLRWPGAWGGTLPRRRPIGLVDGQSPAGPGAAVHVRWRDPAVLLDRAVRR